MRNPFTPTFGAPPPLLVGRRDVLDLFEDALEEGPGSPGYATVYTGSRGIGKTAMLNAAEDLARDAGYQVISETATPGFLQRITEHHMPGLLPRAPRKLKSINIASLGGGELETSTAHAPILRTMIEQYTITKRLLITLDELQAASLAEMRDMSVVLQHAVREGRNLAFCAAGLPTSLDALLADKGVTFIRRADRHVLGAVSQTSVADAFQEVVAANGRTIGAATAQLAARSTGGYPFLIQLVGYHAWRQHPNRKEISADDVSFGSEAAARRVGSLVFEPALNDLSAVDRTFLLAMATDNGPSKMADIANRMNADSNYTSQYRLRLIAAGLIEPSGHGHVTFTLPQLREWLRHHAVYNAIN